MNFDDQEVTRLSNELENARKVIQNLRREKEEMNSSFNKERYELQGRLRALQEANDNLKRNPTVGYDNLNDNNKNNKKKDLRNGSSDSNYNDDLDKFSMQKKIDSLVEEIRSLKENKTKTSHSEWEKQLVKKTSSTYDNDEILKKLKEENRFLKDKLSKQHNYSSSNDKDSKVNGFQWENPTVSTSPSFISEKEAVLLKEIEEYKMEIDELKVYLNQKTKVSGQKSNNNNNNNNNSSKNPLLTDKSVQVTSQSSSGNNKNTNENSSNNPEVSNLKQKLFDSNEEIKKLKLQLKNTNQSTNNTTTTSNQNYSDFNKDSDQLKVFSFVWEGRVETVSLQKKLSQVAKSLEEVIIIVIFIFIIIIIII